MGLAPSDAEVIRGAIRAQLAELFTATVGAVQSYDPDTQTADVLPVMKRAFNIGDGVVDFEDLPVIPNVPVAFPQAGGHFIHFPIVKGDHVLLVFTHDDIANWRETGAPAEPDDLRRHSLGSCVAYAGIADAKTPFSINPLDAALRSAGLVMGKDGSPAQLWWDGDTITAGRPSPLTRVSPAALADRTDSRLQALEAQVTANTLALTALTASVGVIAAAAGSHTHPYAGLAPPAVGNTLAAPSPPAPPGPPPPPFVPIPLTTAADVLKGTGPLP